MSSHREAPEIAKDPVADNTDVYAFVSPDRPDTVTIIANFIPFESPQGGPNFYEFGNDVLYQIHISNHGEPHTDIAYQFRFRTDIRNTSSFLYNLGPINHIGDATWNRPQYYSVTKVIRGQEAHPHVLGAKFTVPPVNVGKRSTPNYEALAAEGIHNLPGGGKVFCGQRADAFWVDLGSIFDLGALRPFNTAHLLPLPTVNGVNGVQGANVHTIAIQVPITELTRKHNKPKADDPLATIGIWASAGRKRIRMYDRKTGRTHLAGHYAQVSRLGNPLFNEVIVPMASKDRWNADHPYQDHRYLDYVKRPELASLLPVLYPGVFPNLAAYKKDRADLVAILLTGIPSGVVPGFQNYTGPKYADLLRLNVAVPPTKSPDPLGLVAGDPAGFPNGRRLTDDVVTIELRAVAGLTIPLVDPSFTPDGAAKAINDGTTNTNNKLLSTFPYMGTPGGGYQAMPGTSPA